MLEDIESAQGELQRADHMIYVTLKYTRTGDVIKNIVERLVGSMNYTITDMLEYAKSKNKLKEVPASDIAKLELLNTVLKPLFAKNKALKEQIDLYMVLKRVSKMPFTVREEYRKNVTLITTETEIDTSTVIAYYGMVKEFFIFSRTWMNEIK